MTNLALTTQIITDTKIKISSEHTIYCDHSIVQGDFNSLQAAYKSLVADAKATGTKIVYKYRTASRIKALKDTLPRAKAHHIALFRLLRLGWKLKLKAGFHSPLCDDPQLAKLYQLSGRFSETMYRNAPVSEMMEIMYDLKTKRSVLSPDTTIYL